VPRLAKVIAEPVFQVAYAVQDAASLEVPAGLDLRARGDPVGRGRACHLLVDGVPAGLDGLHVECAASDGELFQDGLGNGG